MKRGEVWTVSGGKDYASKARPAVVIQDDRFDATASITICLLTTNPVESPLARALIEPTETNGLRAPSRVMVDKIMTVAKSKLGERVGRLADEDMVRLGRAIMVFLGLTG